MKTPPTNILLHLMRKETRQLIPLIAMLSVIGLALQCLHVAVKNDTQQPSELGPLTLAGMPCLFAIGVGAMLIGQEKDSQTLQWLRSMPIRKEQLVAAKLMVALLCLAFVWILSWIVFVVPLQIVLPGDVGETLKLSYAFATPASMVMTVVNTLFLTFCGMAVAWKFQRSFSALAAIIPVASIPWGISAGISSIMARQFDVHSTSTLHEWLTDACLAVATMVAFVCNWTIGIRSLAPTNAPKQRAVSSRTTPSRKLVSWLLRRPQNQILALTRQFAIQNRLSLMILAGLILASATIPVLAHYHTLPKYRDAGDDWVFLVLASLASSWLGVLAFHGDRLHHRIRFLADRGVHPFLVWRTRHSIPVTIICISVLVFYVLETFSRARHSDRSPSMSMSLNVLYTGGLSAGILGVLLSVYSYSQWVGQWIRSPIVAAMVAPASCGFVAYYASYYFLQLGASVLFLPIMLLLPLVVTGCMMQSWMDEKLGMGFHFRNVLCLMACATVPMLPILMHSAISPAMPRTLQEHLYQIAVSIPGSQSYSDVSIDTFQEARRLESRLMEKNRKSILNRKTKTEYLNLISQLDSPFMNESGIERYLASELAFDRMRMEKDREEQIIDNYRVCFGLLAESVKIRRKSLFLKSQDVADETEIALLRELQRPNALEDLGKDLYRETARSLADQVNRDQSRRNALAVSWVNANRYENRSLGGYLFPILEPPNFQFRYPKGWTWERRAIGVKVAHLWDLLETQQSSSIQSAKSAIWKDWYGMVTMPQSDGTHLTVRETYQHFSVPGYYWRGQWEQDALHLYKSLNEATSHDEGNIEREDDHE